MHRQLISAAFSITIAAHALAVSAQGVAQGGDYTGDIAAFHGTPRALIHAINVAQRATRARVVEIRFVTSGGMPGYHLVLQSQHRVTFMHLDEQSGQTVGLTAASVPAWMLDASERSQLHYDRVAKVSLSQAIRTAQQADGGMAIAAGIAKSASNRTSDVHAYNVLLDISGSAKRVSVDSMTGQIISDPDALAEWP